jgi:hypothetical protein
LRLRVLRGLLLVRLLLARSRRGRPRPGPGAVSRR